MKDISEYYQGDRAIQEELGWLESRHFERNLGFVLPIMEEYGVKSVVEFGCGSGLMPWRMPADVDYLGIDANPVFLDLARKRNPQRTFILRDARTVRPRLCDLSLACSFLKHFGLHEVDSITQTVLAAGRIAVINVQILGRDLDNGTEFHHVYITERRLLDTLASAGHVEVKREVFFEGPIEGGEIMRDVWLLSRRV